MNYCSQGHPGTKGACGPCEDERLAKFDTCGVCAAGTTDCKHMDARRETSAFFQGFKLVASFDEITKARW